MKNILFILSVITLPLASCTNSQLIQNNIPLNAVPAKYNEINQEPIPSRTSSLYDALKRTKIEEWQAPGWLDRNTIDSLAPCRIDQSASLFSGKPE